MKSITQSQLDPYARKLLANCRDFEEASLVLQIVRRVEYDRQNPTGCENSPIAQEVHSNHQKRRL